MTLSVKHKFTSGKADGTDVTLVKPSNWNDEHNLTTDGDGLVLGRPPGTGGGPIVEVPIGTMFPTGMVMIFAGPTAPAGWFMCNGVLRPRTDPLFGVIGTTYGAGDGLTTYALPDLRGRVVAGPDLGTNRLTSLSSTGIGGVGGAETKTASTGIGGVGVSGAAGSVQGRVSGTMRFLNAQSNSPTDDGDMGTNVTGGGGGAANTVHRHHTSFAWTLEPYSGAYNDLAIMNGTFNGTIGAGATVVSSAFQIVQATIIMNYIIKE